MSEMRQERYVVVDFETTGFSPANGDRIIEIGAVEVIGNVIGKKFGTLVNPGRLIPTFATNVHSITNEMIALAPSSSDALMSLLKFIDGSTIVAHNSKFEERFLAYECKINGLEISMTTICTLKYSREKYPHFSSHKLKDMLRHLNLQVEDDAHRALPDALMTARLLIFLQE